MSDANPPVSRDELVEDLMLWAIAGAQSAERVMEDTYGIGRNADAALMVIALRNTVRAVERIRRKRQGQAARDAAEGLRQFHARVPGLKDARNVLEHFDDYRDGRGRLQAQTPFTYGFAVRGTGTAAVVEVGPYALPVADAREACNWLTTYGTVALVRDVAGPEATRLEG